MQPAEPTEITSTSTVTTSENGSASEHAKIFYLKDFVIKFAGHQYVVPVRFSRFYLHGDGLWYLVYTLDKSQFSGTLKVTIRFQGERGDLHLEKLVDFPVQCGVSLKIIGGDFPNGLLRDIAKVHILISGSAEPC